jgi:hypothetical protein
MNELESQPIALEMIGRRCQDQRSAESPSSNFFNLHFFYRLFDSYLQHQPLTLQEVGKQCFLETYAS